MTAINMTLYFELLAVLFGGLFCGTATYITFVEHPSRLACGVETAVTVFKRTYRRSAIMQLTLAGAGFGFATAAWLNGSHFGWLLGGLPLGAVIPFTLFTMFPTNRRLLDPNLYKLSYEAGNLLTRWGRLHLVRTCLGTAAMGVFLVLLVIERAT